MSKLFGHPECNEGSLKLWVISSINYKGFFASFRMTGFKVLSCSFEFCVLRFKILFLRNFANNFFDNIF